MSAPRELLLPVSPSPSLAGAVEAVLRRADARDAPTTLHLVRVLSPVGTDTEAESDETLERAARLASERAPPSVKIETALLAPDRYLADPTDHAVEIRQYVDEHGIDLVLLDPNYSIDATDPQLHSVAGALEAAGVPSERLQDLPTRRGPSREEIVRFGGVFLLAFGFYLLVAGQRPLYAVATGGFTAVLVAGLLRNVVFETTPRPVQALETVVRGTIYVPYLLWEIIRANVVIAYVVLHPSLPLETYLDRIDTPLTGGLPVSAFANSVTLTPGTLTVDVEGNDLVVHSMTTGTRLDLLDGPRERAVQFVFRGRMAFDLPTPLERESVVELVGSEPIDSEELEGKDVPTTEGSFDE